MSNTVKCKNLSCQAEYDPEEQFYKVAPDGSRPTTMSITMTEGKIVGVIPLGVCPVCETKNNEVK